MERLEQIFGTTKPLIAMCHLHGLPGRPRHHAARGVDGIVDPLLSDVMKLQDAGVDGLLFCNENDIPYELDVGPEIVAGMSAAVGVVRQYVRVPFGVNILWDPIASLAVARATGAVFVREVMTGVFETDMGLMAPQLGRLAAFRHAIGADEVALFANITPEFSRSVSGRPVGERARGAAYMGVDALLISGPQAGMSADVSSIREAKEAAPGVPVIANTGVTHDNVRDVLGVADGVIVGTSLKTEGITWNEVDAERARRMVGLVREARVPARI